MPEIGSAFVSIAPSARNFGRSLDKQTSGQVAASGKKAGSGWGKAFAIGAAVIVASKAVSFLGDAVSASSDLQESASKVGVVFGAQAEQIRKASETSATAMGLSKEAYLDAAGTLGNLLVSLDLAPKAAATMSQEMVKLAGDMASFNNVSPEDALAALKSGLTGETEPLKAFGVNMNDATLKAQALKMGLIKNTKEALTPQTKALAAQKLIMEQTGTAQGDFARTSDGLANQQRILAAKMENVKAKIGAVLLPAITGIVSYLNKTGIPAFKKISEKVGDAFGAVKDFFTKVKGSDEFATAIDTMATAAGKLKSGFKGAAKALAGIDFGNLDSKQVGEFLGKAMADGLNSLVDLAGPVTSKVAEMFAKVDWVGIGIAIGKQVPALLIGLDAGILNFDLGSLLSGLAAHWQEILLAIVTIAFAPAKFVGVLGKLLTKIPFVGTFLSRFVVWLNEIGGKLLSFGGEVLKAFFRGITAGKVPGAAIVAKVIGGFKGIPGAVKGFFDTLRIRLGVYALEGAQAFGAGIRNGFAVVFRFFGGVGGKILSALGNMVKFLGPKGFAATQGFYEGILQRWPVIVAFVKSIPGKILSTLGNLGRTLYNAGAALMTGFKDGITAKINEAIDAVKAGLQKIKDMLPGSPIKSGPLVSWNNGGAGKRLMELLAKGIKDGAPLVRTAFENVTESLVDNWGKALDKARTKLQGAQSVLAGLMDEAAAMRDSVASAFSSDLFSSETLTDFLTGGLAELTKLATVRDAMAALRRQGASAEFLAALGQSGNADLTLQLAADPAGLAQAQAIYEQQQSLSQEIGQSVADANLKAEITAQTEVIQALRRDLLHVVPANIGKAVARALDGASAGAQRAAA